MFKLNSSLLFVSILSIFMLQTSDAAVAATASMTKTLDTTQKSMTKTAAKKPRLMTYRVFGKRYTVMADSNNYVKKGIASWYGGSFHGRHTSSGEHYNMYAMTAAHKTLPLSTMVLVTNLKNGKQVLVKINDRGPFVSNRLIDLSYGAAKKLGMVQSGLAMVRVQAQV